MGSGTIAGAEIGYFATGLTRRAAAQEEELMRSLIVQVDGMSCGHCVSTVRMALSRTPGVQLRTMQMGRAELTLDESITSPDQVTSAVEQAGYHASIVG